MDLIRDWWQRRTPKTYQQVAFFEDNVKRSASMKAAMKIISPGDPARGAQRLDRAKTNRNRNVHYDDNPALLDDQFRRARVHLKDCKLLSEELWRRDSMTVIFIVNWFGIKKALGM